MKKLIFKFITLTLFALIISTLFTNCDLTKIGLGKSVDTKPPVLSIGYPFTASVIRGTFYMAGQASDDTAVKAVHISFKNLETGASYGPWNADYSADTKKWSLKITNERTKLADDKYAPAPIPDGRYEAIVEASDSANRKTVVKTSYIIDNTPPILLISQPSTIGSDSNATVFAESIVFKGDLWDANSAEKIIFDFYDYANGLQKASHTAENPGGTFEIAIAKNLPSPSAYDELIDGKGPDSFPLPVSWTATVYDNAYKYNDPDNFTVVEEGNATSHYFVRGAIQRKLALGEKMPKAELLSLLDNYGQANGIPASLSFDTIKDLRISSTVKTDPPFDKKLYSSLSLDPFNKAPVVNILGMEAQGGEPYNYNKSIAPGANLPIRISVGPDLNEISYKVSDTEKIKISIYPEGSTDPMNGYDKKVIPEKDITDFGTSVLVNFPVPGQSGNYRLVVHAKDIAGEEARNNTYCYTINQGAPLLESVLPTPSSGIKAFVRPDNNKLRVTVVGKDKDELTLTVYKVENENLTELNSGFTQVSQNKINGTGGDLDTTTWILDFDISGGDGAELNLAFKLNDGTYDSSIVYRNFEVDLSPPTLDLTSNLIGWQGSYSLTIAGTSTDSRSGLEVIEYSLDNTNWFSLANSSSWSATISVAEGSNSLYLRAKDRVGNVQTNAPVTVRVDLTSPEVKVTEPQALVRNNGSQALPVKVNAKDSASGVATVLLRVASNDFSSNTVALSMTSGDDKDGNWEAGIPASHFGGLSSGSTYQVYVQATDSAGRKAMASFPVYVDATLPTVAINQPSNNSLINKTIAISGTAGDDQLLSKVTLSFLKAGGNEGSESDWEEKKVFTGNDAYNWVYSGIDTTADFSAYASPLKVRAQAKDEAGNTSSEIRTYYIDQDSDRPVIRLSNIKTDNSTTLINSTIVSGTLLDDDGTVTLANFAVSEDGSTWIVATASSGDRLYYDVDTRSFQYTPSAGDGLKNLYFKVTDLAGVSFTTPVSYVEAQKLTYPKIQYGSDSGTAVGRYVSFKIDTMPPDISGDIFFDATNPYIFDGPNALDSEYRVLNNSLFGGLRNKFAFRISAQDATGIQSVTVNLNGNYSTTRQSGSAGDWEVFTTNTIDASSWSTGSLTLSVSVKDNSGQTSSTTRQLLIDNEGPTVTITSHSQNEQVTGDLIFRGTATDEGGAGVESVQYQLGADSNWKDVVGTFAWSIDFTSTASNVITTVGSYANSTHATEVSAGIWRLPIKIKVRDKVGNEKIHTHYLHLDPDGDKPVVNVLYPSGGSTLGGTIRIFGSATDNERVDAVWMMIDTNNDGLYDITDKNYLASKGYTVSGTGTPSDPYQFKLDGTASWNYSINKTGEFNPSGANSNTIRFRVRAQDNKGTYGSWSEERTIYVDNTVPQIGSKVPLKLVQFSGANIIAERDYVTGMYIRGEWYLIGSVWDESGIKTINLSGAGSANLTNRGGPASNPDNWFTEDDLVPATGKYNYNLRIPVGKPLSNATAGQLNYSIYVEDASDPTSTVTQVIQINYDNKPPTSGVLSHGGSPISTTNLIIQSNRNFTIESEVQESDSSDSGFERLAFFFVRRGANDRVYNPMIVKGDPSNRTDLSGLTWAIGDIPRLTITGATRSSEDSLQHNSLKNNGNIRVGGL